MLKTSNALCALVGTKWILGNVQNNYRSMTDYVNRQVEIEFHAVGPATAKARRTKVWRWRGTERRWRLAERKKTLSIVSVWEWYAVFLQTLRSFVMILMYNKQWDCESKSSRVKYYNSERRSISTSTSTKLSTSLWSTTVSYNWWWWKLGDDTGWNVVTWLLERV